MSLSWGKNTDKYHFTVQIVKQYYICKISKENSLKIVKGAHFPLFPDRERDTATSVFNLFLLLQVSRENLVHQLYKIFVKCH